MHDQVGVFAFMIQFKICMVGAYAVGKTSLVERYVRGIYSDKYHTTIGVKIDKKLMSLDGTDVSCMLWDIAGEDEFYTVNKNHLRGMSGYFLVLDGTRRATLEIGRRIEARIEVLFPDIPFVLIANKADLSKDWELDQNDVDGFSDRSCDYLETSAKSGSNVELAFEKLGLKMLEAHRVRSADAK